jgi:hypothetical protein
MDRDTVGVLSCHFVYKSLQSVALAMVSLKVRPDYFIDVPWQERSLVV